MQVQTVEPLAVIASRLGVEAMALAAENDLVLDANGAVGQLLAINNGHIVPPVSDDVRILVNIPQRMLFLFERRLFERRVLVGAFPVAAGRADMPTPLGDFHITVKVEQPEWDVPLSIQEEMRSQGRPVLTSVPPGPDNPFGDYWVGLSLPHIGIHGTNTPASVYHHVSHGCMRMLPEHLNVFVSRVTEGMLGRVAYEPVLLARTKKGIFLEAHHDVYKLTRDKAINRVKTIAASGGFSKQIDWEAVKQVLRAKEGVATFVGRTVQ